MEKYIVLNPIG